MIFLVKILWYLSRFLVAIAARLIPVAMVSFVLFCFLTTATLLGPYIYRSALFNVHYNDILYIETVKSDGRSGHGTGFHVTNSKGVQYLITNFHVCASSGTVSINAIDIDENSYPTEIVNISPNRDLCALKKVGDFKSFSISDYFFWGSPLFTLGYPRSLPLVLTFGEPIAIIWNTDMRVDVHQKTCEGYKGEYIDVVGFGHENNGKKNKPKKQKSYTLCKYDYKAIQTTIPIRPGNSGGPIIDMFGRVVGVVMKRDEVNWAIGVFAEDLITFIEGG